MHSARRLTWGLLLAGLAGWLVLAVSLAGPLSAQDAPAYITPTPNPPRPVPPTDGVYVVQPGDTLGTIAQLYGLRIDDILAINRVPDPLRLEVGQPLTVPAGNYVFGPAAKLVPDSELVYSPSASAFDIAAFVSAHPGYLRDYRETIDGESHTGAQIVADIATRFSVNPRLLLALLEYRGGWLSNPAPTGDALTYPLGIRDPERTGLTRQFQAAANELNDGYYGWKYRGRLAHTLADGTRLLFGSTLNPGTVGVQRLLAVDATLAEWQRATGPDGFPRVYRALFGDPFALATEPVTPPDLVQPTLALPFGPGEEWVYTGGPHGGFYSGAGWAAVDFAPPLPSDDRILAQGGCYVSPFWATAAGPGIIARSADGFVVLDLDGDGDEHTGWTLVYLHISADERIATGTRVNTGDPLGHPSCEGGQVSTGTHVHIARRYNGEWIPAQCDACAPGVSVPPMVLGAWTVCGQPGQEYQGCLTRPGPDGYRQAEQTRAYTLNKVSH